MTIELAIAYIPSRMKELGWSSDYTLRFRHFVLQAEEAIKIEAGGQLFILVDNNDAVSVASNFGIYDPSAINVNEFQYEHQGNIHLLNHSCITQQVRFIQVIPKTEQHAGNQ